MQQDPPLENFLQAQPELQLRTNMPELQQKAKHPSLLALAKALVGKDINAPTPLPAELMEPSTELMKRAEDIEYSELLDEASELPKGSTQRLLKVAAFALSPYGGCHADRTCKPLYSLPGETLEAVYPAKGVRYIGEAIQSNGWIIAGHMEGRRWKLATDDQSKPRIWATSMDFLPYWFNELTFDDGEVYTWTKVITSVNNIVTGNYFVAHRGSLEVKQASTGRVAVIKFKEPGLTTMSTKGRKTANRPVTGWIEEHGKKLASPTLSGFWDSHLEATSDVEGTQRLWQKNPLPSDGNRYALPVFMISMSDIPDQLRAKLPKTDSRLRRDIEFLANGIYDKAQEEKVRLEQRGFALVAAKKTNGKPYIPPKWFTREGNADLKPGQGIRWRYAGTYWAAREAGFGGVELPDIFGNGDSGF